MNAHADWPEALGARALDTAEAYQALEAFGAEYGRQPLLLLLHAAVPETLRPDLLHLIRINFVAGRDDPSLEADVLFAPLTQALGNGCFRIEPQVRWHAMILLRSLYRDDTRPRAVRVAELIWRHCERLTRGARVDAELAEYIEVQRWVALAHLDPRGAAQAFAQALQAQAVAEPAARLRLGGLAAAIELPLAGEQELLAYARGLDALVAGDGAGATRWLGALGREPLTVGGVTLKPAHEWLAGAVPARASGAAPKAAARVHRCLLVNGGEIDPAATPDAGTKVNRLALLAALHAVPGCRVESVPRGSTWRDLVPALLQADRVVVDLRQHERDAHLLLGIAWALRPKGVIAVAEHLTAPDGVPSGFDVHRGTTSERAADASALAATLQRAIEADEKTAPYDAWPELEPPQRLAQGEWPLPSKPPPTECLLLGDAANAQSQNVMQMQLAPRSLPQPVPQPLRYLDLAAVRSLASVDLALVDWTSQRDVALLLGLRWGLQPLGTLVMAASQRRDEHWLADELLLYDDAPNRPSAQLSARVADRLRQTATQRNALYAALPGLCPPRWPAPLAAGGRRFKVFVSYVRAYAEFAQALVEALKWSGDFEVFSDHRLVAGDDWSDLLGRWLNDADAVVAVVGAMTAKSENAMREVNAAIGLRKRLIPVAVDLGDWSELPPQLRALQGISVGRSEQQGRLRDQALQRLVAQISVALAQSGAAARAPAQPRAAATSALDLRIGRPQAALLRFEWEFGERARSETVSLQPRLVGPLLQRQASTPALDGELVSTLRELLLPAALKESLSTMLATRSVRLHLDDGAATLPWELLLGWSGASAAPAAPPPALLRVAGRLPDASGVRRALLVADPLNGGDPEGRHYPPLAGVEHEVRRVAEALSAGGFAVETSLREDARAVLTKLFASPLRVLLLAGHGLLDTRGEAGRRASGLVLSDGAFLGVNELMALEKLPELLILDVEWMGRSGGPDSGEADRDAAPRRLLEGGCSCLVAPAWQVADATATEFTDTLVRALGAGDDIEAALRRAREAALVANPGSSTWAAYQVWAPPGYRLLLPPAA